MRDESKTVRSYRDLIVWQKSISLAVFIYKVSQSFPREEIYGLTSQMRRAAVSVASNIAEGNARQSPGEFLQFLGNARGSLAELYTQITIAIRLEMIPHETELKLFEQLDEVGRLLNALRSSIASRKSKGPGGSSSNP